MKYSEETEKMIASCKDQGLNLWPMLAIFKKRSKLKPEIPEPVIRAICLKYSKRAGTLRADFPYFLEVLKRKSREYFATQQVSEHARIKKEPMAIKNIFKELAERQ